MKRFSLFVVAGFIFLFTAQGNMSGQNFFKTDANMFKLLADTTFASIAEVTFLPGQKTKTHTHSAQFVYALSDGALTVHYANGKTESLMLKTGDYFLAPADGPHWTENTGTTAVKFLLVEFDEHPYIEKKMKK